MPENAGLYSKFEVRTRNGEPLESGSFVLRPFNADGSVHDEAAVRALVAYADYCTVADADVIASAIREWLAHPNEHEATKSLNK